MSDILLFHPCKMNKPPEASHEPSYIACMLHLARRPDVVEVGTSSVAAAIKLRRTNISKRSCEECRGASQADKHHLTTRSHRNMCFHWVRWLPKIRNRSGGGLGFGPSGSRGSLGGPVGIWDADVFQVGESDSLVRLPVASSSST